MARGEMPGTSDGNMPLMSSMWQKRQLTRDPRDKELEGRADVEASMPMEIGNGSVVKNVEDLYVIMPLLEDCNVVHPWFVQYIDPGTAPLLITIIVRLLGRKISSFTNFLTYTSHGSFLWGVCKV
jgi:hypothetical protein